MSIELDRRLAEVRRLTFEGGVPVRRRDMVLYEALASCLALCEYVQAEGLIEELRAAVIEDPTGPRGKGGRFVKSTSDVYTMVCRYAFGNPKDRSSIVKYSQTLREAVARQISSHRLALYLKANGGTRALYLKVRTDNGSTGSKRTLHLNEAADYPLVGPFTLTLRYDGKGFFDVLEGPRRASI